MVKWLNGFPFLLKIKKTSYFVRHVSIGRQLPHIQSIRILLLQSPRHEERLLRSDDRTQPYRHPILTNDTPSGASELPQLLQTLLLLVSLRNECERADQPLPFGIPFLQELTQPLQRRQKHPRQNQQHLRPLSPADKKIQPLRERHIPPRYDRYRLPPFRSIHHFVQLLMKATRFDHPNHCRLLSPPVRRRAAATP